MLLGIILNCVENNPEEDIDTNEILMTEVIVTTKGKEIISYLVEKTTMHAITRHNIFNNKSIYLIYNETNSEGMKSRVFTFMDRYFESIF